MCCFPLLSVSEKGGQSEKSTVTSGFGIWHSGTAGQGYSVAQPLDEVQYFVTYQRLCITQKGFFVSIKAFE